MGLNIGEGLFIGLITCTMGSFLIWKGLKPILVEKRFKVSFKDTFRYGKNSFYDIMLPLPVKSQETEINIFKHKEITVLGYDEGLILESGAKKVVPQTFDDK